MNLTMKIALLISFTVAAFSISSCSEDTDARLGASSVTCAFKALGGEKIISIKTTEESWSATVNSDNHFGVTQEDNHLTITSLENLTEKPKSAVVTIRSGNALLNINVTQGYYGSGEDDVLTLNPSIESHEFKSDGGDLKIAVTSMHLWDAKSDSKWCTIDVDNVTGVLTVTAENNGEDVHRTAKVTIESIGIEKELVFTQSTRAEHPYASLLGWWDLYCPKWKLNGNVVAAEKELESFASCLITEDDFGKTFIFNHLFMDNAVRGAYYSTEDDRINIPMGWKVLEIGTDSYYLSFVSITAPDWSAGTLTCIISEDRKSMTLEGSGLGWSVGIFQGAGGIFNYAINGVYYPNSPELILKKRTATYAP